MQDTDKNFNYWERRQEQRKLVKISVLLKMGAYLKGRGYVKNISISGLYLESPNLFQQIRADRADEFVGSTIKLYFPSEALTINGTIIRIETKKGSAAIWIADTSNDTMWQELCNEVI